MKNLIAALTLLLIILPGQAALAGFWDQLQGVSKKVLEATNTTTKTPATRTMAVALSRKDIVLGLKDALLVGSKRVVSTLGQKDAFYKNKKIHIPLPDNFKIVQTTLGRLGMSGLLDDLELRMNRAAEQAVPRAEPVFARTIRAMTIKDAMAIYKGSDDAATRYFEKKMSRSLQAAMRPIVQKSLAQSGAVAVYDQVMGRYKSVPFVPDIKNELTADVLNRSLAAVFDYLAREEAAIRRNPLKRTTSILRRVFSANQ
ncbi:DUF4197 domain-containing protein [Desulfobacterota bacterium M19]